MAISATARGTGTHNSSATTFTLSPSGNFAIRSMAALVIAADNSNTNGAAFSTFTVTDPLGNTWTRRTSPLYDPGAANAGVEGAIFTTPMNGGLLLSSTVITVTFNVVATAKAWVMWEVVPDAGSIPSYVTGGVNAGAASAAPTVTTGSITNGDLVIGALHNEYGTAQTVTADADTTNGTWSAQQAAEIGTTAAGMNTASQTKVVTATATQTYNPTLGTSSNVILSWIQVSQTTLATVKSDTFNRGDASPNFGTSSGGDVWTTAAACSILSNKGRVTHGASSSLFIMLGTTSMADFDAKIMFQASNATNWDAEILARFDNVDTWVRAGFFVPTNQVFMQQRRGGSSTSVGSNVGITISAATDYWIRFQGEGATLRVKIWLTTVLEPAAWDITGTTDITAAGLIGLTSFATTAYNADWDDLNIGAIGVNDPLIPHRSPMPQLLAQ